jgi:transporter family-2 protein
MTTSLFAALAIGACLSLQPPINAAMARTLGSPLLAAVVSIAISLAVVIPVWLTAGQGAGDLTQLRALPWWVLLGGVIGVVFVAGSVVVAPVLGIALFFVCVVAGRYAGRPLRCVRRCAEAGRPLEARGYRARVGRCRAGPAEWSLEARSLVIVSPGIRSMR